MGMWLSWGAQDGLETSRITLHKASPSTCTCKSSAHAYRQQKHICLLGTPLKHHRTPPPEPIFSAHPPGPGAPSSAAWSPRADPSHSLPTGSNESRTPGLEHKCNRFYFISFGCSLLEGWRWVGPSSSCHAVLTVLGSQHAAHSAQELVQGSMDLWGQGSRVVDGHHHQEALSQELQGKRRR